MATFQIYRNLNKPGFCSIRQSGLVKNHAQELIAFGCDFHVGESGRLRVIKNRRKNVHAWVKVRNYEIKQNVNTDGMQELYYDPYYTQHFHSLVDGTIVYSADVVVYKNNRIFSGGVK